ncbi:hypothetical protein bsdcttw_14250 [Anaerocolumna chitinilytica]|uniref:Uncharacterized protein n=1 Tax=Anaerocolumna chitinilytica TaxID=1727145 RepID=A0A7I8DM37_9FIRM|nr:hypothetical protein bsdcttw_14250 [Anaerocolumna chitinilytica]
MPQKMMVRIWVTIKNLDSFSISPLEGRVTHHRCITGKIPLCVTVVTQRDLVGRPEPQKWEESHTLL